MDRRIDGKIGVVGLGYVGIVTAAVFAERGEQVIGIEVNPSKVADLRKGKTPVQEPGLAPIIETCVGDGRMTVSDDVNTLMEDASVVFVCVGTPMRDNGEVQLGAVQRVAEQLGRALPDAADPYPILVFRSTMPPGTMDDLVIPALERASGQKAGQDFGVCFLPEFLREGSALDDFINPSRTVIGSEDARVTEVIGRLVDIPGVPLAICPLRVAEFVKYVDNIWHATKITFANEIGLLAATLGVDAATANNIFLMDDKLNISVRYLRPGFAYGGSCLPKDLSAMNFIARQHGLRLPMLSVISDSNQRQIERGLKRILATGARRVGFLGLAFKPKTDDLRESPYLELAERLIGKGVQLRIFDSALDVSALVGSNREHLMARIPHLMELMTDHPAQAIEDVDTVVLSHATPEYLEAVAAMGSSQVLVDLVGLAEAPSTEADVALLWDGER